MTQTQTFRQEVEINAAPKNNAVLLMMHKNCLELYLWLEIWPQQTFAVMYSRDTFYDKIQIFFLVIFSPMWPGESCGFLVFYVVLLDFVISDTLTVFIHDFFITKGGEKNAGSYSLTWAAGYGKQKSYCDYSDRYYDCDGIRS